MHAPLRDRAPPTRKAIIARGILIVQNIESIMGSIPSGVPLPVMWPPIIPNRSPNEIYTLPALMHQTRIKRHRTADITIFSPVPRLLMIVLVWFVINILVSGHTTILVCLSNDLFNELVLDVIERLCEVAELICIDCLTPLESSISYMLVGT